MPDAARFQQAFGAALAGQRPPSSAALARALAIHRNTAAMAARDALSDNFPVVRQLVGDAPFEAAADRYVAAAPPVDPRLCLYGSDFAAFVGTHAPFRTLPYLQEVAALERLIVEALFARDAPALGADASTTLDLDAPLPLHPAVRFARFACPAGTIWQAHQPGGGAGALEDLTWSAETVVVTRPQDEVVVTTLPPDAAGFLVACASTRPLGEAAARVDPASLASLFAVLIAAGAFA